MHRLRRYCASLLRHLPDGDLTHAVQRNEDAAAHRAHAGWTSSRLVSWGNGVGEPVGRLVEHILSSRPHPEHGYRACMGLRRLVGRYGPERVVAACERALAIKAVSFRSVDSILKNGLDRVAMEAKPEQAPVAHENVRGADYYRTVA